MDVDIAAVAADGTAVEPTHAALLSNDEDCMIAAAAAEMNSFAAGNVVSGY